MTRVISVLGSFGMLVTSSFAPLMAMEGNSQPKELRIAANEIPGFNTADGKGIYLDFYRELYAAEQITVSYRTCPVKRCNELVKIGEADATLELFEHEIDALVFPKYPMSVIRLFATFLKDKFTWNGPAVMKDRKTTWLRGYDLHTAIPVPMKWSEVDTIGQGIGLVLLGRVDFYLDDVNLINDFLKEPKHQKDAPKLAQGSATQFFLFPGFTKSARGEALRDVFNRQLPSYVTSGKLKALYTKYGYLELYNLLSAEITQRSK
jgi:polar amino acid transport system substrate-binding protein